MSEAPAKDEAERVAHEAELRQRAYYADTAEAYDQLHGGDVEHERALDHIAATMAGMGLGSLLDVGAGTGRAVKYLAGRSPGLEVRGVEPVAELIDQADPSIASLIVQGRGEMLPFEDNSFDAVSEFAVLHHVRDPGAVVAEMIRVARRAVFLSDENRFGRGARSLRLLKLGLYRAGVWGAVNRAKTRGRGYRLSEGDGLSYSYSVYDSLGQIAEWADEIQLISTRTEGPVTWAHPLLTSPNVLLCATRDDS